MEGENQMSEQIKTVAFNDEQKIVRLSITRKDLVIIITTMEEDCVKLQNPSVNIILVDSIIAYPEPGDGAFVVAFQINHTNGGEERIRTTDWGVLYEHRLNKTVAEIINENEPGKRKDRP